MSVELDALLRLLELHGSRLSTPTPEAEGAHDAGLRAAIGVGDEPTSPTAPSAGPVAARSADDLLTVSEVAALLKVTRRWLYRHARTLPFARKLSRKVLRFSRAGIARWLATKRP